jgi:site-specific recombinase XerD
MVGLGDEPRDLASLVVLADGRLEATGDPWEPYRLLSPDGGVVGPVAVYLSDLQAAGRSEGTQRSYGMDLLRWFRFLRVIGVAWDEATRVEARDFCRWIQITDKPSRASSMSADKCAAVVVGTTNPVTGKPAASARTYASSTSRHSESVLRGFYEFHLEAGSGPMVNPFPLARGRSTNRVNAHHNPMDVFRDERAGLYRPRLAKRIPRGIPDERFNELFAALSSMRDRALVALWVSTGARASELLGAAQGDADPGQQLITVVRKGSRALQALPASVDAFVWLRLYQAQIQGLVPQGRDQPLWWTQRRPFRRLTYHAAYRMFTRVNAGLGSNWSLHDLRHTAAYRMARDPDVPLADVQWVLGHAQLSTTQIYLNPLPADVIASVLAHHRRQAEGGVNAAREKVPTSAYRSETLGILFGGDRT